MDEERGETAMKTRQNFMGIPSGSEPFDAVLELLTHVEPSDTHAARLRVVEALATAPDSVLFKRVRVSDSVR